MDDHYRRACAYTGWGGEVAVQRAGGGWVGDVGHRALPEQGDAAGDVVGGWILVEVFFAGCSLRFLVCFWGGLGD